MARYLEHIPTVQYGFVEIEADTLEELIERRKAYMALKEKKPDGFNKEMDKLNLKKPAGGDKTTF